jgi:hypothetical protein
LLAGFTAKRPADNTCPVGSTIKSRGTVFGVQAKCLMRLVSATLAVSSLMVSHAAFAVPLNLQQQGRVLDATGTPVRGSHEITFAIYDAPGAETPTWSKTFTVDFDDGYYSVALGDGSPALTSELFATDDLWLGVQIDSSPELANRSPLRSVPFAIHADTAVNVTGGIVDATVILGNPGDTCTSSEEGTVRYVNDTFEGCTSTGWIVFGMLGGPDPFSFADQINVGRSTLTLSNIVQITGLSSSVAVALSGDGGPSARSCSDATCDSVVRNWTSDLSVSDGEYLQVRQTSSANLSIMRSATVTIGRSSDVWSITTVTSETEPSQQAYTTPGTYSWTAPADVTSVSVVAVGGGGGGGRNSDTGQTPGGDSYFLSPSTVRGGGGGHGVNAFGTFTGDGGGNGGYSNTTGNPFSGGGGAGGYAGNGGYGGIGDGSGSTQVAGGAGSGGGGGGGGWASGGGVGILGQGPSGAGSSAGAAMGGGGGSGGVNGKTYIDGSSSNPLIQRGGAYGGGGGSTYYYGGSGGGLGWTNDIPVVPGNVYTVVVGDGGLPDTQWSYAGQGGGGAVRIIWGSDRAFPSTGTTDQ